MSAYDPELCRELIRNARAVSGLVAPGVALIANLADQLEAAQIEIGERDATEHNLRSLADLHRKQIREADAEIGALRRELEDRTSGP